MAQSRLSDLKRILEGIISYNQATRIASLVLAMQWYDAVFAKADGQGPEAAKALAQAAKCRNHGMGTNFDAEKETAFRKALLFFEKAFGPTTVGAVEECYNRLEEQKVILKKKYDQMLEKYGAVANLLQKGLRPKSSGGQEITIYIDSETNRGQDRQFNPELNMLFYSRARAKALRRMAYHEGPLVALFAELPFVATACSIRADRDAGVYKPDLDLKLKATTAMLQAIIAWAGSAEAPNRLVRKQFGQKKVPSDVAKKSSSGFGGRHGPRAPLVDGLYMEGCGLEIIYSALKSGTWMLKVDLQKLISSSVEKRIKSLEQDGRRGKGAWTIERDGDRVRMKMVAR
jgi:hypothetical protein